MRRIITVILLMAVLAAGTALAKEKTYGKGLSEGDFTKVSTIMADPKAYDGKTVRVEGTAVGVCAHRGDWVSLTSDVEGETMRVKVREGVITFPKEVIGEHVRVEGVFTINRVEKICDSTRDGDAVVKCNTFYEITCSGALIDWK